jgi:DNA polymerase
LLRELIVEAEIAPDEVYLTNAVKHFKWTPRGKRRLHAKPSARETTACRPWLEAEIEAIKPTAIVCLGATAVYSVLGPKIKLTRDRGRPLVTPWNAMAFCTYHPSAALRAPTSADRERLRSMIAQDLRAAGRA